MGTSNTPNLECVRFVRQVSNGCARTKYSYLQMQVDLLEALRVAPWRMAECDMSEVTTVVNKVSQTDKVVNPDTGFIISLPTYTAFIDDKYDAYKQAGDGDQTNDTMCGYAGMVAYRYTLPSMSDSVSLSNVKVPVQTSRYLRSGLRVVVAKSGSGYASPPEDWDILRGELDTSSSSPSGFDILVKSETMPDTGEYNGVLSWGLCGQKEVEYLISSRPWEGELSSDMDVPLDSNDRYLWIFVSVEDYTDYWTMYNAKEQRYYSIEGSGTVIASAVRWTFSAPILEYEGVESYAGTLGAGTVNHDAITVTSANGYPNLANLSLLYYEAAFVAYTDKLAVLHRAFTVAPDASDIMFSDFSIGTTGHMDPLGWVMPNSMNYYLDGVVSHSEMGQVIPIRLNGTFNNQRISWCARLQGSAGAVVSRPNPVGDIYSIDPKTTSYVVVTFGAVSIPPRTTLIKRIKVESTIENTNNGPQGADEMGRYSLMAWRVGSPDALSLFMNIAIASLAKKRAFFTGEALRVSGSCSITDEGKPSNNYPGISRNISVNADLIGVGRISAGVDGNKKNYTYIDVGQTINPGEIVVLVPRCDMVYKEPEVNDVKGMCANLMAPSVTFL